MEEQPDHHHHHHLPAAVAPNTCQRTLRTRRGDYLIQASWPPAWGDGDGDTGSRTNPTAPDQPVPAIYLLDGNAYFFTATELVRRTSASHPALVVAIGYPATPTDLPFHPRRSADFTPPGAADFLAVLEEDVVPFVARTMFPGVAMGPRALWGHERGGLFALFALFSGGGGAGRPGLFDTVVAASPAVWWDGGRVLEVEREFRGRGEGGGAEGAEAEVEAGVGKPRPQLFVMYGSDEQFPKRRLHEGEGEFALRKRYAAERRMKDNAIELGSRLRDSGLLRKVWLQEFQDEDHGGAALCALNRGITGFLEGCSLA